MKGVSTVIRLRLKIAITIAGLAAIHIVAQNQGHSNQPKLDLSGKWKTDQGDEVLITKSGVHVRASLVAGGACRWGGSRDYYLDGDLQDHSLHGTLQLCTSNKKLLDDCHLTDPDTVKFQATANRNSIKGTYDSDYINFDVKDGNYVNCRVAPGKGGPTGFSLSRICNPDKKQGCGAIGRALQTIVAAEQPAGSTSVYQGLQQSLGPQLDQIRTDLCDNQAAQSQLDKIQKDLDSLHFLPGQSNLGNNRRLVRIEDGLRGLNQSQCGVTPPATSGVCASDEKPAGSDDEQAARFIRDKFKEAYDQASDEARKLQARGAPVSPQLRDKVKNYKKAMEYWENIKAASCVPPNVLQTMQEVSRDIKSGRYSDNCAAMCITLADWYKKMIVQGNSDLSDPIRDAMVKAFRDDCMARCP